MPIKQNLASLLRLALSAHGESLPGQSTARSLTRGVHEYQVRGFYEGQEMEPWSAELSVIDTTMDGDAALRALYKARPVAGTYLFTYSVVWKRDNPQVLRATWVNN